MHLQIKKNNNNNKREAKKFCKEENGKNQENKGQENQAEGFEWPRWGTHRVINLWKLHF